MGSSWLDLVGIIWFFTAWLGYTWFADKTKWQEKSITAVMNRYRFDWMLVMMQRDLRMVDTSIVGNILTGVAFFASTTILVIGGLMATLGAADAAMEVIAELPFAMPTSRTFWELKTLLLAGIFVYAFFKFAWSFRLYNNSSVLIGAAPLPPVDDDEARRYAARVGSLLGYATQHFNRGMRAYFFSMPVLAWLFSPQAFLVASTVVVIVIYRREFRSRSLRSVSSYDPLGTDG